MTPFRLLRLWHLCSLDAPTVAVVWTWFVSRSFDVVPPNELYYAMFFGVWGLYILDRVLDAAPLFCSHKRELLRARHQFHFRHQKIMAALFLGCALASTSCALFLPLNLLLAYLAIVALLALYFALIHLWARSDQLPKELAVGIFFSAAVFLPSMKMQFANVSNGILLAALCILNGLFIQQWEKDDHKKPHFSAIALLAICLVQSAISAESIWKLPACMAISLSLFLVLHLLRHKIEALTLRSCADFALLTPVLFYISLT